MIILPEHVSPCSTTESGKKKLIVNSKIGSVFATNSRLPLTYSILLAPVILTVKSFVPDSGFAFEAEFIILQSFETFAA